MDREIDFSQIKFLEEYTYESCKYTRGRSKIPKKGEFYIDRNYLYINTLSKRTSLYTKIISVSWNYNKSSFAAYWGYIDIFQPYYTDSADIVVAHYKPCGGYTFAGSYQKFLLDLDNFCIQNEDDIENLVKKHDSYLYKFLKEHKQSMFLGICFPKIEILYKAGYKIAKDIIDSGKDFNMKTVRGLCDMKETNPRSILRVPNYALPDLKNADLNRCHFLRLVSQLHGISEKEYRWYAESGLTRKDLEYFTIKKDSCNIDHTLIRCFGKDLKTPYIWFTKCIEYLKKDGRGVYGAINIIIDYKKMCDSLSIKFDKSPEYLVKNHDMVAKLYRENKAMLEEEKRKREKLDALEIIAGCKKYNFEDNEFSIRTVERYKDIVDEATQQHNCVASYWYNVIRGQTMIFFMRRKSDPENSYVTVELSYDLTIRQAYLKGNQRITDEKTNNFLKTWRKFVIETKKKERGI